jgi:hypothetical protein
MGEKHLPRPGAVVQSIDALRRSRRSGRAGPATARSRTTLLAASHMRRDVRLRAAETRARLVLWAEAQGAHVQLVSHDGNRVVWGSCDRFQMAEMPLSIDGVREMWVKLVGFSSQVLQGAQSTGASARSFQNAEMKPRKRIPEVV